MAMRTPLVAALISQAVLMECQKAALLVPAALKTAWKSATALNCAWVSVSMGEMARVFATCILSQARNSSGKGISMAR